MKIKVIKKELFYSSLGDERPRPVNSKLHVSAEGGLKAALSELTDENVINTISNFIKV